MFLGAWQRAYFSPKATEKREKMMAEAIEAERVARESLRAAAIARMEGREGYGTVKEAIGEVNWKKRS